MLLGLTSRSPGSQSIILATDPVPEVGWMIFDVSMGWQSEVKVKVSSLLTLEETVAWNSEPVLNHKLKCTFNVGTWCISGWLLVTKPQQSDRHPQSMAGAGLAMEKGYSEAKLPANNPCLYRVNSTCS